MSSSYDTKAAQMVAEEGLPFQQAIRQLRQADSNACPSCHSPAGPDAKFCTECGTALQGQCPACAAPVQGGDFCEECGHWLLPGQCRFCYAALGEGARYCEECGCNQSGLSCPRCRTTGFFDFCSTCGDAVSERGMTLLTQVVADSALEQALRGMQQLQSQMEYLQSESRDSIATIGSTGPLIPREALQVLRDMEAAQHPQHALDGQGACEAQVLMPAQPAQMTLSAQLREASKTFEALLKANEEETFPDPQSARLQLMHQRSRLAQSGQVPTGWRCVAFGAIHKTPNECSRPQNGGTWIF